LANLPEEGEVSSFGNFASSSVSILTVPIMSIPAEGKAEIAGGLPRV
jgi:hypothetical protein